MAKTYSCDVDGSKLNPAEVSTLRLSGPLARLLNRRELHVGPEGSYDVATLFNTPVARPEGMAEVEPESPPKPKRRRKG